LKVNIKKNSENFKNSKAKHNNNNIVHNISQEAQLHS